MKNIICILQNAWGDHLFPVVFEPNPYNKSAKIIRKMVGKEHDFFFCNTTGVVTETANGKPPIDNNHFENVILSISLKQITDYPYKLMLICGRQAEKAACEYKEKLNALNIPMLIVPHPASRSLSNKQIEDIKVKIENILSD